MRPYSEIQDIGHIYREFSNDVDDTELVWHRDRKDRIVEIMDGIDWKFQFDNQLPINIHVGDVLYIKANQFHRILKGKTPLKVKIKE
jgi:quercetin dioxygenase-like cupin family protein